MHRILNAQNPARRRASRSIAGLPRWRFVFGCLPLLLALCLPAQAAPPSPCTQVAREKWLWQSGFDDFVPPFFETRPPQIPPPSFHSCYQCGLWLDEAWPSTWNPPAVRRPLSAGKTACYRWLDMEEAALSACRRTLLQDPFGEQAGPCVDTIVEILFHGRNLETAVSFFERLDPAQQALASPESLYLLGQSEFILHRDAQASARLEQIPPGAEVYPLAVYARMQLAFRSGDMGQARTLLESLVGEGEALPGPDVLAEQVRLTLARILFQEQRHEEAADLFRRLRRSRYFLPEALMGMGWTYEAMGSPAGAIAFFEAAQEAAPLDVLFQTRATLERARLHAENGLHEEADRIFDQAQTRMESYLRFLEAASRDPAWLTGTARALLPSSPGVSGDTAPPAARDPELEAFHDPADAGGAGSLPDDVQEFQEELTAVLQKERFVSARMQALDTIRDALLQVRSLLDRPTAAGAFRYPSKRGISTRPTPPLDTRETLLAPETVQRLDAAFSLMDTEFRLYLSLEAMGLCDAEQRSLYVLDAMDYYTGALASLVLGDSPDATEAHRTLAGLMALVRHLPYPMEDRERILRKLVHTQDALRRGEETLLRWASSAAEIASGDDPPPPRQCLLRWWVPYVKSLVYIRSWQDRSPAVFLLPSLTSGPAAVPALPPPTEGSAQILSARLAEVWQRLGAGLRGEIVRFCGERAAAFETLLTDSELYHAEALLKVQESLLEQLQLLPADAEEGETRDAPHPASDLSPLDGSGTKPEAPRQPSVR